MASHYQTINTTSSLITEALAGRGNPAPTLASAADATAAPATVKLDPGAELMMYDEIWAKLLMLSKRLRDMMNAYNAQRQALSWQLDVNALTKTRSGIEKAFQAAMVSATGGIVNGVCTGAGAFSGVRKIRGEEASKGDIHQRNTILENNINRGRDVGQSASSAFTMGGSELTKEADTAKAEADLLNKSAQAYAKTQEELQAQVREVMRQMLEMGQKYVEQYSQALQHLVR